MATLASKKNDKKSQTSTSKSSQTMNSKTSQDGSSKTSQDGTKSSQDGTSKSSQEGFTKASQDGSSKMGSSSSSSNSNGAGKSKSGKQQKTLENLLEDGLKDIYSAEKQLMEALPKMAKAAGSEELQDAFEEHLQQTKRHIERLDKVFARLEMEATEEEECEAMKGLITEAEKVIEEYAPSSVKDSALIICAQKVEHYEIASYGSICELADVLGHGAIVNLLDRTLQEEGDTDHKLSALAQQINDEAFEESQQNSESGRGGYQMSNMSNYEEADFG